MQLRSATRRQAAPPAAEPEPEWEALPQGVSMRSLRPHPQLLAWRKVLVDLAETVHQANLWMRTCVHNARCLFERQHMAPGFYIPPPPQAFLDAFYPAAVASCHRGLRERLAELLGATGYADMVTAEDLAAERELSRSSGHGGWDAYIEGAKVLSWRQGDMDWGWTRDTVDAIEKVVRMVQEHGMRLFEILVLATLEIWESHRFMVAVIGADCALVDLSDWIEAYEEELGAPLMEVLLEMG
ncbi:hypothetical protein FOA52_004955 [Chlamydomonas sp. UWO 241]|nr:hypothetical protein FOA52_004955 [Chlamydomonas sp. UWO 241]